MLDPIISTSTSHYQLLKFHCTNVHPQRYARPIFWNAIFRWRHESQQYLTTKSRKQFNFGEWQKINPLRSKAIKYNPFLNWLFYLYLQFRSPKELLEVCSHLVKPSGTMLTNTAHQNKRSESQSIKIISCFQMPGIMLIN